MERRKIRFWTNNRTDKVTTLLLELLITAKVGMKPKQGYIFLKNVSCIPRHLKEGTTFFPKFSKTY